MNIPVSDLPITDGGLDSVTEIESQKKLDETQQILKQHWGDNWKIVIVLMAFFVFGLIVLIIYGINFSTSTSPSSSPTTSISEIFRESFQAVKPHLKIFFIIIIVSIVFFCVWFVVKPEKDTTTYGVVPFPTDKPYIPPDSTSCGTGIVNCTSNNDCSACSEKDGTNKYECTKIENGKQVYYLGTPLQPGQSYCLPKQSKEQLDSCATYTGKAVFTSSNDGEKWECQCLYPDLFSGDKCDEQIACATPDSQGSPPRLTGIVDGKKVYWDPKAMDPSVIGTTPYDRDPKTLNAIFTCDCESVSGYNTYPNDPYVCHKDMCYSGVDGSASSVFDKNTMECVCDGGDAPNSNRSVFKSNISGYCYSYGSASCSPHPVTGLCTYGLVPFTGGDHKTPIMFVMDGIPYITYPIVSKNYDVLVDVSGVAPISGKVDISTTLFKDTFRAFPIIKFSDLPQDDQNIVKSAVNSDATTADVISSVIDKSSQGYVTYCNSYFYNRGTNYPACNDQLSKTGTDFVPTCKDTSSICGKTDSGDSAGKCHTDLNNGHTCTCIDGYKLNSGGICTACTKDGHKSYGNVKRCCSNKQHVDTNCAVGCHGDANCILLCNVCGPI